MSEIIFVDGRPGGGPCRICGQLEETRFGVCFDCADAAERRALQRGVIGHLAAALSRVAHRDWFGARVCVCWAWERLTKTGDYAPGGYADV